ncbi:PAS domain-containing sensor histidine kinase [Microbacterium sp. X-17]|uniref:sensor histidine kinase n=1 Tax=Microbacterium sp. X-17 TaxID=3144404 RepID=UPI0031F4C805
MSAGGDALSPAPMSRTRSIWLTQLLMAGSVAIISVVVLGIMPEQFASWNYPTGVAIIFLTTILALVLPWAKLPRDLVLILPYGDVLGVAAMTLGSDMQFAFFWVFPVIWIATHFRIGALIAVIAAIAVGVLVDSAVSGANDTVALRLMIVTISLLFIGLTTHFAAAQTRAFKQLLRRQAQRMQDTIQRVSAQEQRVSRMLNGLDVGIARIGADGDILAINDTYIELYGIDREDHTRPARAVEYATLRGNALSELVRPLARAMRGEALEDERVWLYDAAGSWHALSVTTRPLDGVDGEPASTLLIVHDVTDLIESENARERLAAVVSHELRNPLTAIIGHAELALDDRTLAPTTREQLEIIDSAGQRMQHLISDILTASQREEPASHDPVRLDLRGVLEASLESFLPAATLRGVRVTIELADPLPVLGDAFRLRQVIDNVLSNAIKYTPRDGIVEIGGRADSRVVAVTIADTGIGISSEDLPRIFDPYFRAGTAHESETPGTGLGMGISRDILTEHGGSIDVDSEAGLGTSVTIVLPAANELV